MNKHTPGPWVVCIQDGDDGAFTVFAESQVIGGRVSASEWDRCIATTGLDHEEFEANARLIAAAPDLLQALRVAYSDIQRLPGHTIDMLGRIEAAIAKAEVRT